MNAIGYVRGSMETQELTLAVQKDRIKAYAYSKELILIDILIEAGKSGKNLERPKMKKLLKMVDSREVDAVITYKIDRMFRNTQDALRIADIFQKAGVAFHSIYESIDTASPWGKFFYTIISAFAELERNVIGARIKDILNHKKNNGAVYGPISYGWDRKNGYIVFDDKGNPKLKGGFLVKNQEEQKIIKKIYKLRMNGFSLRSIANELNHLGIHTKTDKLWKAQQIKNILNKGGT